MYSNWELFLSSKVVTKKHMVTFATHFISRRILAQFTIEEKVSHKTEDKLFLIESNLSIFKTDCKG